MNIFSEEFNNFLLNLIIETTRQTVQKTKDTIQTNVEELIIGPKPENKLTLTIEEASKLSGIGRNKISELIYKENTDFPYFKVGSKYLINREMLIKWLEQISIERRNL